MSTVSRFRMQSPPNSPVCKLPTYRRCVGSVFYPQAPRIVHAEWPRGLPGFGAVRDRSFD